MKRSQKTSRKPAGAGGEPASAQAVAGNAPAVPARSRRWLFRLIAVFVLPLVALFTLEVGLRLAGYGYDSHFFKPWRIGGEDFLVQNDAFSFRFFPPQTVRHPEALRMKAVKGPGTLRIFVLGESAAMGDPEPAFGPARYLEVLLRQRYPDVDFEVVNVAFTAINSHVVLPIARECAQHGGDIWIVYLGNNEMVGPYGAVTVFGAQAPPRSFVKSALALQKTRVGQWGRSLLQRVQKPSTEAASWGGMSMFLENRVSPDSPKRERVYRNFEGNLEDILEAGLESGAGIILSTMAVSLRDSPPFASMADPTLSSADAARFKAALDAGKQAEAAGKDAQALHAFIEASDLDPGFAEAHYRQGTCLDRLGREAEARREYQLACNTDALPFRTDARLNDLIRQSAQDHAGDQFRLLDVEAELPRRSGVEILGEETFYEHVHFNFNGGYQLGRLWADAVAGLLPDSILARSTGEWAARESCERALGLTDWNRKLVTDSVMQRLQQPPLSTQFNNPDRVQRLQAYQKLLAASMTAENAKAARAMCQEAIAERPEDHYLYEAYAAFLQATGDLAGATRQWEIVSGLLPQDFLPWFQIGVLQSRQGNHAAAEQNLRKALELRPALIEGWSELGQSLGIERRWDPALNAFQRACALRPLDPSLWAYQAKVLGEMGRSAEAVQAYRKALELNPSYWQAQGALGDLLAQSGNVPEAVTAYEAVLRVQPDNVTAVFNLGSLLLRQGRVNDARRAFLRVLELDPNHAPARDQLQRLESGTLPRL